MQPSSPPDVGQRLRELRKERGLTLRTLAERSGISLNAVSLIERGQTSPTVGTLHRLAAAMGVRVADFFGPPEVEDVVFVPANGRGQTRTAGMLVESLGTGLAGQRLEPFLIVLRSGAGSEPVTHAGQEFAFGLRGRIEYSVGERSFRLNEGDALLFDASLPHSWRNDTEQEASILLVFETMQARASTQLLPHLESKAEGEAPPSAPESEAG